MLDGLSGNDRVPSAHWDWPLAENTTNAVWRDTVGRLKTVHAELREAVRKLADSKLDNPVVEVASSSYVVLHGLVYDNISLEGAIALSRICSESIRVYSAARFPRLFQNCLELQY